jgi:hypothetical protein
LIVNNKKGGPKSPSKISIERLFFTFFSALGLVFALFIAVGLILAFSLIAAACSFSFTISTGTDELSILVIVC